MAADSSVGRGWEEEECRLLLRIWRPGLRAAILRDKMADETNEHTNTQAEAAEKLCILFVINKVEQRERERGTRGRQLQKKTANYIHFDERKLLQAAAWC